MDSFMDLFMDPLMDPSVLTRQPVILTISGLNSALILDQIINRADSVKRVLKRVSEWASEWVSKRVSDWVSERVLMTWRSLYEPHDTFMSPTAD